MTYRFNSLSTANHSDVKCFDNETYVMATGELALLSTIPERNQTKYFSKFENRLELDHLKAAAQHEGAGGRCEYAEGFRVELSPHSPTCIETVAKPPPIVPTRLENGVESSSTFPPKGVKQLLHLTIGSPTRRK